MKKITYLIIFSIIIHQGVIAQTASNTANEIQTTDIETKLAAFNESLLMKYKNMDELQKRFLIQYQADTFRIETIYRSNNAICTNETDKTACIEKMAEEYNKLVTKYYMMLNQELNSEEKEKLKHAQRSWLSSKDSEREFLTSINASRPDITSEITHRQEALIYLTLTKARLNMIKDYLLLIY